MHFALLSKWLASLTAVNSMANTKKTLAAMIETRDGVKGLVLTAFLPFDGGFSAQKDGNKWLQPVKARDAEGNLLKGGSDGKQQLFIVTKGKEPLHYRALDGTIASCTGSTGTEPYTDATKRSIKPEYMTEQRQATPHIDASLSVTPSDFVWPNDNMVRDIRVEVKANNPRTLEAFNAEGEKKAATRGKTKADLQSELEALRAKAAAAGVTL